jgi:hypothetical protein
MVHAPENLLRPLRAARQYWQLPAAAREEGRRDRRGLPKEDPGIDQCVDAGIAWLAHAQDRSASYDGGVARHFSLLTEWSTSYPETTGYIVPTLLTYADRRHDAGTRARAKRMLDWLTSLQFAEGGFQGGMILEQPVVPVVFNTGQILIGLAGGVGSFGEAYRDSMIRAADWLISVQDVDGCWRRHGSPFAKAGEKAYDTHVAWGLFEAARIEPGRGYAEAAMTNVRWALSLQQSNGWFDRCCLTNPSQPLTHTVGYVLRGVIEAYRFTRETYLLGACLRTADGLLSALDPQGFLPGRLQADWKPAVRWACLTGTAQIAVCWLMLYAETGREAYLDAACRANRYVRRTVNVNGPLDIRGGVKGSFPVDGTYNAYQYLNWACKFMIDANLLERTVGPC